MVIPDTPEDPGVRFDGAPEDILPEAEVADEQGATAFDPAALFAEAEPSQKQVVRPEPGPELQPEPDRLENDIRELRQNYKDLEERHHRTMEIMLANTQQQQPEMPETFGDIDPEVDKLVRPVVQRDMAEMRKEQKQFVDTWGPMLQRVGRMIAEEEIAGNLKKYKEHKQEVMKEFGKLSPDERERYNTDVGAEALYARVLERKLDQTQGSDLKEEAVTETRQEQKITKPPSPDNIDWESMSDEEFEKVDAWLKKKWSNYGGSPPIR